MNKALFKQTFLRLKNMKSSRAYAEFLEHIDQSGDIWKIPQVELARWWEQRQSSRLELEINPRGVLSVSCPEKNIVVEINGDTLRAVPFSWRVSESLPPGPVTLRLPYRGRQPHVLNEILGHFGYGHLTVDSRSQAADIPGSELETLVEIFHRDLLENHHPEGSTIDRLTALLEACHHRKGIPALRLWSLPHSRGRPYRGAVTTRIDVDRAINNLTAMHALEMKHGIRSTVYFRAMGPFYRLRDIRRYSQRSFETEIALHGEFITTAQKKFGNEFTSAKAEKALIEEIAGRKIHGVSLHGGEFRSNWTPVTRDAIEQAGFSYELLSGKSYFFPVHLPCGQRMRKTLSISINCKDIGTPPEPDFEKKFLDDLINRFSSAVKAGGFFVAVFHPLYFDVGKYFRSPSSYYRVITSHRT